MLFVLASTIAHLVSGIARMRLFGSGSAHTLSTTNSCHNYDEALKDAVAL